MPNCSTCTLSQGFQRDCESKPGGGHKQRLYLLNFCDLATGTEDDFVRAYGSNVVEDISLAPGKCFYEIVAEKNLVNTTQTRNDNGSISQVVNFTLTTRALAATKYEAAQAANDIVDKLIKADGEFVAILVERDGTAFVYGVQSGLEVTASERTTGSAQTDTPAFAITLTAVDSSHAPALDTTAYTITPCP